MQGELAFLALTDWKQQNPYLHSGLSGFPFMEVLTRLPLITRARGMSVSELSYIVKLCISEVCFLFPFKDAFQDG